jgi:hypothetical protein
MGAGAGAVAGADSVAGAARLVALRVYDADADGAAITTEVEAMAQVGALPALYDLATLADGRTCVVVERIAGPSLARLVLERGLTCGEAVTVLAPIAVALGEFERHGFAHTRLAPSDVVFDDSGRPRLIGTGALRSLDAPHADPAARTALLRDMSAAFAQLVDEVALVTRPAGALDPVRSLLAELLDARPFRTRPDEVERLLFALATPKPVMSLPGAVVLGTAAHRLDTAGPPVAGGPSSGPRETPGDVVAHAPPASDLPNEPSVAGERAELPPPAQRRWLPGIFASVSGVVDEALPDETAGERSWRAGMSAARSEWPGVLAARCRALIAARSGVLIVGALAGAGALVLALTLVPPADEKPGRAAHAAPASTPPQSGETATETAAPASAEPESAAPQPSAPESSAAESSAADAAAATADLLRRREECFAELGLVCLEQVLQPGSGIDAADRVALVAAQGGEPGSRPEFALDAARVTGEMGGAWLVEVPYRDDERQPASVLVMRSEAGWRLREIFAATER